MKTFQKTRVTIFLLFLAFFFMELVSGATITFVDPTPNNTLNTTSYFFYFNITSNENLNQSLLSWTNATNTTNFSMSNTSLTNWNLNLTNSTTPLGEGSYTYKVWAQNTTGSWNLTETRTLTIDRTTPVITNTTINDTAPTNNTTFLIQAYYNESNLRYANLSILYSNGTLLNYTLMNLFPGENKANKTFSITNKEGNFTFQLTLTDWAGNNVTNNTIYQSDGNSTQYFVVDDKSPTLSVIYPTNYTNLVNPLIRVNITDLNLNNSTIKLYFNNSEINSANFSLNPIENGYQLKYTTQNLDNNTNYYVNISAQDIYGHELTPIQGSWSFKTDFTSPTSISNFKINEAESAVKTPTSNYTYTRNNLTLNWTLASDSETFVDHYAILLRNKSFNKVTGTFNSWNSWFTFKSVSNTTTSYSITNLSDSYEYEFKVKTYDAANNSNTSITLNATIDFKGPEFSAYENGTFARYPIRWTNLTNLTIWVNITDISGINNKSINLTFNNSPINFTITPLVQNNTIYKITFNATNLENNKNYPVTLTANDSLNQENSSITYNITPDFNPPNSINVSNLSYPYPGSGGWYKDSVIIQVNCSDSLSGIAAYTVNDSVIGNSWVSDTNSSHNFTISDNGDLTYLFKCKDKAGNIQTTTKKIPVDSADPSMDFSSRSPTGSGVSTTTTFSINYSDSESGIDTSKCVLEFKISSEDSYTYLSDVTCTQTGLSKSVSLASATTYDVRATVYDKVGHSDQKTWSFTTQSASSTTSGSSSSTNLSSSNTSGSTGGENKTYTLAWLDVPTEVNVLQGNTTTFEVKLKSSGTETIGEINITLSGTFNKTIEPSYLSSLDSGKTKLVEISINAKENQSVGIYNLTLKAQGDKASSTANIILKVQPKETEKGKIKKTMETLIQNFRELKKLLEKANETVENTSSLEGIISLVSKIESLLSKANTSLIKGDYAEAAELQREIQNKINSAKTSLENILKNNKAPIWLYIVIPIVVLAIVGVIIYSSLIPEEKKKEKRFKVELPKGKKQKEVKGRKKEIKGPKDKIEEKREIEYDHKRELKKLRKQEIKNNLGEYTKKLGKKLKGFIKKS